ncbi:MAG: NifU family protein [Firmicutes bacterium]|nr:NifU family protein [Bacillota bacterium]MBR0482243.1 NifU family protein [Bacillota bacterium]
MASKLQIESVIDQIRPFLQRDGGDVKFIDYTPENYVVVELQGHCAGCPHAQMTIKNGIERILKENYPEVEGVKSVNDMMEDEIW